jgi:AsmA family protein
MFRSKILWAGVILLAGMIVGAYLVVSNYDYDSLKPRIAQRVKDETGRDLVLGEKINLKFGLSPAIVLGNIALQNANWGSRPEMVIVKRLEIEVALIPLILGRIDIKRFVLIQPDILIETDRSGRSNFSFEAGAPSGTSAGKTMPSEAGALTLPALTAEEVNIEAGKVVYRDGRSGKSYSFEISDFRAEAKNEVSPVNLKLKGLCNRLPIEISGSLGPWVALTSTQDYLIDLTGTLGKIDMAVKGMIKDVPHLRHLDLQVHAKGNDLSDLKPLVGEPLSSQSPFEAAFRITDPSVHVYRVSDINVVLGSSDVSGSVEVDLSEERTTLSGGLASKRLDLRPFVAEGGAETAEAEKKRARSPSHERVFSETLLPLEPLGKMDVIMKAQVDKILLREIAVDATTSDIALKSGELKINPLKATVGGGALNAALDLKLVGGTALMKTELKVEQLDAASMMKELGKGSLLDGRLDIDLDVNGEGVSEAEIMSGLNGRVVLTMGHGKIRNSSIDRLGGDISSSLFLLLNPFGKRVDYTAVNCLVSGFSIRDGMATTTAFALDTDEMSIIGEGDVNLRTEEIDLSLDPVPKKGIGTGLAGKLSVSLDELAKPFKLAGTLAHPSLGIDVTKAAETTAKAIGGFGLFGPAGIVSLFVTESSEEGSLCRAAVEAAQKGVKLSLVENKAKTKGVLGEAAQGLEQGLGDIGRGLKGLFSK